MQKKIKTLPDLAGTSPTHQQARENRIEHFSTWQANVADHFKGMDIAVIKAELQKTSFPFAVCFENVIGDFNMSTGIRNANAFNAREVFYLGNKKWDKRGSVGTYNYIDVSWLSSVEDFVKLKEKYTIVGVDNIPGAKSIRNYIFNKNTLLVFGEEGVGLTNITKSLCDDLIYINQFGSVRSLNVGTASGIVMNCFVNQMLDNGFPNV